MHFRFTYTGIELKMLHTAANLWKLHGSGNAVWLIRNYKTTVNTSDHWVYPVPVTRSRKNSTRPRKSQYNDKGKLIQRCAEKGKKRHNRHGYQHDILPPIYDVKLCHETENKKRNLVIKEWKHDKRFTDCCIFHLRYTNIVNSYIHCYIKRGGKKMK